MHKYVTALGTLLVLLACGVGAQAIIMETVPVGNPGNAGELSGEGAGGWGPDRICGAVDYTYNIGKYPVTAGQYTAFLNAVAGVDTYALYNTSMSNISFGSGITRSGNGTVDNPYTYTVDTAFLNRPVNFVCWGDAARFANWLHNGQPTGAQDASTTEDGAYTLNGAMTDEELLAVSRNNNSKWAISTEDEWYKAAYYDPTTEYYYTYPTSSDSINTSMANYNLSVFHPTNVGSYPYPSPWGTFDQGGNVFEWNEAMLDGSYRGLRGGSFSSSEHYLRASYRYSSSPTVEGVNIGFRVVEVPEPELTTIIIDGCDTGVTNQMLTNGVSMADEIAKAAADATNHGRFVRAIAHLTNEWQKQGLITGNEKGRIQVCAAQADIP